MAKNIFWIESFPYHDYVNFSTLKQKDKSYVSLREQLAAVSPVLDNLKCKKEERIKQYYDIQSQIEKIRSELSEPSDQGDNANNPAADEHDLSTRKLNSYQAELRALKKDKVKQIILNILVNLNSWVASQNISFIATLVKYI